MNRTVEVMSDEDFMKWIDSGGGLADLSLVDRGELLFQRSGCTQCHSVDGSEGTGPSLKASTDEMKILRTERLPSRMKTISANRFSIRIGKS